ERLTGDRLHDPVDDAVARGGLHPDPVHGRPHRAAVPRVRRDHRHGDPGLRLRVADPDPDARQPLPAALADGEPRPAVPRAGARGYTTSNSGVLFMHLKPRKERSSIDEVVQRLRAHLSAVPGMRVYPQVPPSIQLGGAVTKGLYQYTLQSPDTDDLYRVAP